MKDKQERVIRRYQNRKLYDTQASRYVTLDEIAEMVKEGIDVKVIDNRTKKDLTALTLTQILFEEEKKDKSILPLSALKKILQVGQDSMTDFVERVILPGLQSIGQARGEVEKVLERLVHRGKIGEDDRQNLIHEVYATTQKTVEDLGQHIDENVGRFLDGIRSISALTEKVAQLEKDVEELEALVRERLKDSSTS